MTGLSQRLQQAESRIETRRLLVTVQTATSPRRYPAITKRLFVSSKVKTSAWASRLSGFWGNELENGRANQSLPSSPLISAGTRRSISVPPSFWMLLTVALAIFNHSRARVQCPFDILPSPQCCVGWRNTPRCQLPYTYSRSKPACDNPPGPSVYFSDRDIAVGKKGPNSNTGYHASLWDRVQLMGLFTWTKWTEGPT